MKSDTTACTTTRLSNSGNPAKALRRGVLALMISLGLGMAFPSAQGQETLYEFSGPDGNIPAGGLARDSAGNLYGTTYYGGLGSGVVFKLAANGNETTLHKFTCGADGCGPAATLIRDAAGNLYGTTMLGGDPVCQCGVVFKMDKNGNETVLHNFVGGRMALSLPRPWSETRRETCMAPRRRAGTATDSYSSWMRRAKKLCCIASVEERTAPSLPVA